MAFLYFLENSMARDNELLKQAIADAKTVRETALANARMVLEEAFKPQLSSMISTRLRNEAEDVNEENMQSSGIAGSSVTADEPGPTEPAKKVRSSSNITNKDQEVDTMGEGMEDLTALGASDDDEDVLDIHGDGLGDDNAGVDLHGMSGEPSLGHGKAREYEALPDVSHDPAAVQGGEGGMGAPEMGGGQGGPGAEDMGDDALDLEAIIRELEADTQDSLQEPQLEQFDDVRAGQEVDGPIKMKENSVPSSTFRKKLHRVKKSQEIKIVPVNLMLMLRPLKAFRVARKLHRVKM
jgi:hypothetical protein